MDFVVGIQARAKSTRLPGKNFYNLGGKKLCEWSILQAKLYFPTSLIYLLVPEDHYCDLFKDIANIHGIRTLLGSEEDVLSRYEALSFRYPDSCIVRWTGDNPIKCRQAMEYLQQQYGAQENNYVAWSNLRKTAVELIPSGILSSIRSSDFFTDQCSEHVTFGLRHGEFINKTLLRDDALDLPRSSDQMITVDTVNDFRAVEKLVIREKLNPHNKIYLADKNVRV